MSEMRRMKDMSCSTTINDCLPLSDKNNSAVRSVSWSVMPATGSSSNSKKGVEVTAGTTIEKVYSLFPALADRRNLKAGNMSGGQQQMLAFGLAILGSPRCVLLEEPSVGLQPDLVEELFGYFRVICREHDMSAILIEHRITSALKIVDDVLILNNGRVVYHDNVEATRNHDIWQYF